MFGESTTANEADIDAGKPAVDGSSASSDATLDDASTMPQIVPTGALLPSQPGASSVNDFSPVACPNDGVIYGIKASTYSSEGRLCRLQILCATLQIGPLGVERVENPIPIPVDGIGSCASNQAITDAGSSICDGNAVATGIYLHQYPATPKVFYEVGLACSNVSETAIVSLGARSIWIGSTPPFGPDQSQVSSLCNPIDANNTVATRLTGLARESISRLGLSCQTLDVQGTP